MKLRIGTIIAPANPDDNLYIGAQLKNMGLKIRAEDGHGGWITVVDIAAIIDGTSDSFNLQDSNGDNLACTMYLEEYDVGAETGLVVLDIPLVRFTDSVKLNLELNYNRYITHSNVYTIYGYDLGNSVKYSTVDNNYNGVHTGLTTPWSTPWMENSLVSQNVHSEQNDSVVFGNPPFIIEFLPLLVQSGDNILEFDMVAPVIAIPEPKNFNGLIPNKVYLYAGMSNDISIPITAGLRFKVYSISDTGVTYTVGTSIQIDANSILGHDVSIDKNVNLAGGWTVIGNFKVTTKYPIFANAIENRVNGLPITNGMSLYGNCEFTIHTTMDNLFKLLVDRVPLFSFTGLLVKLDILVDGVVVHGAHKHVALIDGTSILDSTVNIAYSEATTALTFDIGDATYGIAMYSRAIDYGIKMNSVDIRDITIGDLTTIANITNDQYDVVPLGALSNAQYEVFVKNGIIGMAGDINGFTLLTDIVSDYVASGYFTPITVTTPKRHQLVGAVGLTQRDMHLSPLANVSGYVFATAAILDNTDVSVYGAENYILESAGCGSFTVVKITNAPVVVLIKIFNPTTSVFETVSGYPVTILETSTINLGDGMYEIYVDSDPAVGFISMCQIINCVNTAIKNITCGCCKDDDCKKSAYSKFNTVITLWNTLFNMIAMYSDTMNPTESFLTEYPLEVRLDISRLMDRLKDICEDCPSITKTCKTC